MLLRRITKHVTDQNWFAVFIDFLIVVVGVFIGIQVANWNADRAANVQLDQQLVSFRLELENNQLHFETYRQSLIEQMNEVAYIREAFKSDLMEVDAGTIENKLLNIQRYKVLAPQLTTFEELSQSGGLRRLSGTPIRQALDEWESELSEVKRGYADGLNQRDNVFNPFMMKSIAYGSLLEQSFIIGETIGTSKFRNDWIELAASREFDNQIAYRSGISGSIVYYLDQLIIETDELIVLLKNREGQ